MADEITLRDEEDFNTLYAHFIDTGGLTRPGVDEDYELRYRGLERHVPKLCIHGKTELTCDECNLNGYRPKWSND
jgi:hypothetical protein